MPIKMIPFDEVFSWLNNEDATHLSAANQLSVLQLDMKDQFQQHEKSGKLHFEAIKTSLLNSSASSVNDLEALELKIVLAKYAYREADFERAKKLLIYVVERYPRSSHRLAIATWLLGLTYWQNADYELAYQTLHQVQKLLKDLAEQKKNNPSESRIYDWYSKNLKELDIDLAYTEEEAMDWLKEWEPSHLTSSARILADEINNKTKARQFMQAFEVGLQLAAVTKNRMDSSETAEAWIIIGLAAYQMDQIKFAIDCWARGSSSYPPYSHGQAVARWMMGLAQWNNPEDYAIAINNWHKAIETFQSLQTTADHENNQEKREWYEKTIGIMQIALHRAAKAINS